VGAARIKVLGLRLPTPVISGQKFFGSFFQKRTFLLPCLVLLFFVVLHAVDLPAYVWFTRIPDGVAKPQPFVDLRSVLQAGACWRAGVDVYRPSACLGGEFNYAPFMLRVLFVPVWATAACGVLLALGFIASLSWLPRAQAWAMAAAVVSPTVYYGIEQGNFDVLMFILAAGGVRLVLRGRQGPGLGLFGLAAACKFYPAALMVLALRASRRRLAVLAAGGAVLLGLYLERYGHGVAEAIGILPSGTPFRATFGRIDLARGLNLLHVLSARRVDGWVGPVFSSGAAMAGAVSWLMGLAAMLGAGLRLGAARRTLAGLDAARAAYLVAGAAVTVLCFYAAQNVYYRAMFLILTIPGLARRRALLAAVLLLLWEAVPRAACGGWVGFWLLREGLWWWVIVELGAVVLAFVTAEVARLRLEN
jgi:hypothetical protein